MATEDLMELPIDRFCNRVLGLLRVRMSSSDWHRFESQLHLPPPGVIPTSGPWSEEAMAQTFRRTSG